MSSNASKLTINTVFTVSMACCAGIGVWGIVSPDGMTGTMLGFTNYSLTGVSWAWLFICSSFLFLSIYMAFGPYGHIRLGKDDEEPEFSTVSWIAMLFAGGMGSGLLLWGPAEPMYHYISPPGMEGGTAAAARQALVITNLHWGFHAWAIYAICALVIAYFTFRRGQPSMISTPIKALFNGRTGDAMGNVADTLAVLSVVFGLAGSLAMGTLAVRSGSFYAFGTDESVTTAIIILGILFVCYMLSATTGVDKGIKILSNVNMVIAILIMLLVLFAGPTRFLLETFIDSIGNYFAGMITMSFKLFPFEDLGGWSAGWTLTYLIWWIAWGPFIGIFVARISRGRTIREFCVGVILVPTLFSMLWFAVFGGAGFYIEMFAGGGLQEIIFEDATKALFAFLGYFPGGHVLNILAVTLMFIFLVTSADSGTFVLSMMTTDGNLNPPVMQKMVWGTLIAAITTGTILSESVAVAKAMAITGAIPFTVIVLLQIVGFMREIKKERAPLKPIEARGEAVGSSGAS
ncbi:BCCT family transporter [Denitrobaculum tricleocarpae]|uniref:BCCT family transporter n=1 Tax=Denitrobaculum tricleocarpae TaxID=2591009 RepID=A0A545TT54_9PROT|nr:BCCT family transporter [Denitrobaculum tricleocarpae]TQV80398.1 BCCT family transporter [Denitrobaculum tricleocarpae]